MFIRILFLAILLGGASACAHQQYVPNAMVFPFLSEKGQASGSWMISHPELNGFYNLRAAYNPWRNVTGMVQYQAISSAAGSHPNRPKDNQYTSLNYLEGIFGGKYVIPKTNIALGLYTGAGKGKMKNSYGEDIFSEVRYSNYFLQPTLMVQGKVLQLGLACRLSNLVFGKGKISPLIPNEQLQELRNIKDYAPLTMLETGFYAGFYFKPITWTLAVQNIKTTESLSIDQFGMRPSSVIVGINVHFHELRKKKKTPAPN